MRIETGRGVLTLALEVENGRAQRVTVDMGEPILELEKIPVQGGAGQSALFKQVADHAYRIGLELDGRPLDATFVSMGNPHATFYHDDVKSIDLEKIGPRIEHYAAFPKRINAHFVQIVSRDEVIMRTWERGSGITMACGTGACAVAVSGVLTGKTNRKLLAHLPGGDLLLEWRESDNHVYMTGPATEVFHGEWNG
jgi:diaminopimelate epimerase